MQMNVCNVTKRTRARNLLQRTEVGILNSIRNTSCFLVDTAQNGCNQTGHPIQNGIGASITETGLISQSCNRLPSMGNKRTRANPRTKEP